MIVKKIALIFILTLLALSSCVPPNSLYKDGWMFNQGVRGDIVRIAKKYLGVRYKRGGASPSGFDCSGYVMYVYDRNGISLPRTTEDQYYSGKRISLNQAKPGDLVFFQTSRKRISHVGIYIGSYRFIHAPRTGKKVSFADMKKSYWKKRYIGSVTYLSIGQKNRI